MVALAQWGLRIPPTLVFITILGMGATGVWWGIAFSHVVAAVVVAAWFLVGDWDQRVIQQSDDDREASDEVPPTEE